jgi:hypothetical protein
MAKITLKTAKRAATRVKRAEVRQVVSRAINGHVLATPSRTVKAKPKIRIAAKRA